MRVMVIEKKAILWTYKPLSTGDFEIRIRITCYRDVKYIGIGYSSRKEDWNESAECPFPSHPDFKAIVKKIEDIKEEIDFEVRLAKRNGEEVLAMAELKKRVQKKNKKIAPTKILQFFDTVYNELEAAGRIGYAEVFKHCKSTVSKSLGEKDKSFFAFDSSDAKSYELFLMDNVKEKSSISHYLRTFYRLWNMAIDKGYCTKEHHPKHHIKFKVYKKHKTKKRAVPIEYIKAVGDLQFDQTTRLFLSQQSFLFLYYARGLNYMDFAKLQQENIKHGYLKYRRSKNGRDYDFKLHPKCLAILKIFKNYPVQSDAGYIFPVLFSQHDTAKKMRSRIHDMLAKMNEDMEIIAGMISAPKRMTSYVARHSFASNLRRKKVDTRIIKEALGHESEAQTEVYLDTIDDSIIAEAIENALTL
jgi:site-specific recombinase XerD